MSRLSTTAFPLLVCAMGIAVIVRTAQAGAHSPLALGYLLGGGMVVVGALRLWLGRRGGMR